MTNDQLKALIIAILSAGDRASGRYEVLCADTLEGLSGEAERIIEAGEIWQGPR